MYLTIAVTFRVYCLPRPFIKRLLYEDVLAGMCVCVVGGGGGRLGRWVVKNVLYGEAPPRGPTPYPFMNHF